MLTPSGCTLAAQSASRRVVSLAAWMPLSVNCTKLMYVGMTLLLQVLPESVSADHRGLTPFLRSRSSGFDPFSSSVPCDPPQFLHGSLFFALFFATGLPRQSRTQSAGLESSLPISRAS